MEWLDPAVVDFPLSDRCKPSSSRLWQSMAMASTAQLLARSRLGADHWKAKFAMALSEFMGRSGTQAICESALLRMRWPDGFVCPQCRLDKSSSFETQHGHRLWQCSRFAEYAYRFNRRFIPRSIVACILQDCARMMPMKVAKIRLAESHR